MRRIYSSPLQVYILLGFLAIFGIYCGMSLPVSLFPNSSKPIVHISVSYGSITAEEFLNTYGTPLESKLHEISAGKVEVEKISASYSAQNAGYDIEFKWGTPGREALRETQLLVASFVNEFPTKEMRDSVGVSLANENSGFLAISFYSDTRSLDDLYKFLEPLLIPQVSQVQDTSDVELWNPSRKEVQIQLDPGKMAGFQLFPNDISNQVSQSLQSGGGGTVRIGVTSYDVIRPRQVNSVEKLGGVFIQTPSQRYVRLSDIATTIDFAAPITNNRSFKTSGAPSLILFANPKPGGNIKKMSEEILTSVQSLLTTLPQDIKFKILVDPSEFIREAVNNVFREVILAALLAVLILFLFIGNVKNVITASIEISMSVVLAFILMKMTGINLNLISLGGLALSAGMNVDASVVVMENIFRHFEKAQHQDPSKNLSFDDKLKILCEAVNEVRLPVIASTIASLVVFIPLAFTSELTNAILGDLALAVVFSHGFSAVVALILVPTVRLQMMSLGGASHSKSPIEKSLHWLETHYEIALGQFLQKFKIKNIVYSSLALVLALLIFFVVPRLHKEIIGTPDTDWLFLSLNTQGNTLVKQMESSAEEMESQLLDKFGDHIQYTFTQVWGPNGGAVMARLKDKSEMQEIWKQLEKIFVNTPTLTYSVNPWNPSEMKIPDPPNMKIAIRGSDPLNNLKAAREIQYEMQEQKSFSHLYSSPGIDHRENIVMTPHFQQWTQLQAQGVKISADDLSDLSRVATLGRLVDQMPIDNKLTPIVISFPQGSVSSLEDLSSFPIGIHGKLVPLNALVDLTTTETRPTIRREDQREVINLYGKVDKGDDEQTKPGLEKAEKIVQLWKEKNPSSTVNVQFLDANIELNSALGQLLKAVIISVVLIFLVMLLQFGNVVNSLIVLVAIPLGLIGVLISLFIFKSTLSLNSVLGVILLNGIVVANSIILVDFMLRLVREGLAPREAALLAAKTRLRPILMTSLTTGLGMLPVALGFGEGGRILQPLGIAVTGGLFISVLLTLFVVPSLQVSYLEFKGRKNV